MSTKNIKELNRENYLQKTEEMLLNYSDAYFYKKYFLLGEGIDKDKLLFYIQLNEALCTDNCEMTKFITNKIQGKLDKCEHKTKQIFHNMLKLTHQNIYTSNCCTNKVDKCLNCTWSEISF